MGDVECKKKLIEVLVELITPVRERRTQYKNDQQLVLKQAAEKANHFADKTLQLAKEAMQQIY